MISFADLIPFRKAFEYPAKSKPLKEFSPRQIAVGITPQGFESDSYKRKKLTEKISEVANVLTNSRIA